MPPVLEPRELLRLARPAALMGLAAVAETGAFLGSTVLVGVVAADALVAHSLAFRAMAACYLLLAGLGQAVTIRIAFLGGRTSPRHEAHACRAIISCILVLVLLLAALFVLAEWPVARLMSHTIGSGDERLVGEIVALLPLAGLALAAAAPTHVVCAFLRGKGRAAAPVAILAAGRWGVGFTGMLILGAAGLGAAGIWTGLFLGAATASTCGLLYIRKGRKRIKAGHSAA
jgi:multidrug resistance protein, MATE family